MLKIKAKFTNTTSCTRSQPIGQRLELMQQAGFDEISEAAALSPFRVLHFLKSPLLHLVL